MAARLADRLVAARRRAFVGRRAELALFGEVLAARHCQVLHVHGPGGVGKTTLLHEFARRGEAAGRRVVWLDGRDAAAGPAAALECLARALPAPEPPHPSDPVTALGELAGLLLLVDTAEVLVELDPWLRDELLAGLADDALVVLAGREPPSLAWRTDPGWRDVTRAVPLRNLAPGESRELLTLGGVPESAHAAAVDFTHGHPLALALVADVCAQRGGGFPEAAAPEVVTALLARLLDEVPTAAHRAALEACALVRVTTEPLLAALLDVDDARALFDWLRDLSLTEYGPRGVFPHDLARDALAAELRWRHPARHDDLHRRAGVYYQQRFSSSDPVAAQAVLADFAYLHRDSPVMAPFLATFTPGAAAGGLRPATAADTTALVELVERHEGPASARLAEQWFARCPGATFVAGDRDGFVTVLMLDADTEQADDPAVQAARAYLRANAPLRAGEFATLVRFWLAADGYQAVSAVQTQLMLHVIHLYLTTPGVAVSLVPYADPDAWAAASAYVDMARLPQADFSVGGRHYGVYGHDWRVVPPVAWLALLADRETAAAPLAVAPAARAAPLRVLDAEEFGQAVRVALRDLGRPDRLASSPLLRSRIVLSRAGADGDDAARVRAVQDAVRQAAAQLEDSPRDRRAYRAVHHTYLQPAATQQAAADLLDLPMTTYRRHLAAGLERVTAILWAAELTTPE